MFNSGKILNPIDMLIDRYGSLSPPTPPETADIWNGLSMLGSTMTSVHEYHHFKDSIFIHDDSASLRLSAINRTITTAKA